MPVYTIKSMVPSSVYPLPSNWESRQVKLDYL
ncbi:unnamed protein product [Spirodela intermedia]|uniref:Uncharacterized protein n=2 Tax=Spirodela intermedia TaxID=51605 RepID=A0A7I8KXD7_SPIIN|nr:unnamed protein product [Spirodela intermedia]CAA6665444.1 unnamed protein product [Spirodela intermedia]CAA7402182.1 unnamed protein product [Spirodela intermedia]